METKKLNFAEMGKSLTRTEMKQIMAGSGSDCDWCSTNSECSDMGTGGLECVNNCCQ